MRKKLRNVTIIGAIVGFFLFMFLYAYRGTLVSLVLIPLVALLSRSAVKHLDGDLDED